MLNTIRSAAAAQRLAPLVIERGDVVLFAFPDLGNDERPCVVMEAETRGGSRYITLAPGEPHPPKIARGHEIVVGRRVAIEIAGLAEAHLFHADRRLSVSEGHPGFGAAGPRAIGALDPQDLARLNAVRARIQAMRDIAAESRRRRRPTPRMASILTARPSPERKGGRI